MNDRPSKTNLDLALTQLRNAAGSHWAMRYEHDHWLKIVLAAIGTARSSLEDIASSVPGTTTLQMARTATMALEAMGSAVETPQSSSKTVNDLVAAMRAALKLRSGGEFRMTVAHATALLDEIERLRAALQRNVEEGDHAAACVAAAALIPAHETASPQAPIAWIEVGDTGTILASDMYAPGLPPGTHDLYCGSEALAPYMRAEKAGETAAQPFTQRDAEAMANVAISMDRDAYKAKLVNVAAWIENGCDPKQAAQELRLMAGAAVKASGLSPLDMSPKEFEIARQRASQKTNEPRKEPAEDFGHEDCEICDEARKPALPRNER